MSEKAMDLETLRQRARDALETGELNWSDLDRVDDDDRERLIEDLRIHQAELEIQNRELVEARALAEAERTRYQSLFEGLPVPALVVDRMGVIEEANQAAVDFFGFRASRALRRHSVFRLFGDRGGNWFGPAVEQAGAGGEPSLSERVPVLRADGEEVPMDCLAMRLGTRYHADRHTLLMLVDRTLERDHDRERALYGSLMANTDALVYAFDHAGRCLLMNDAAARHFGVDGDRARGARRIDCMAADRAEREARADRRALYEARPQTEELRCPDASGLEAVFAVTRFALRDERDAAFAVAVIATDVTEQRRLQSRLDLATEIFSRGSEAIVISNSAHKIIFANAAFERISGYPEADILGRNPLELLSDRHGHDFLLEVKSRLDSDGFWDGEIWPRRRDGESFPGWLRISRVQSASEGAAHHVLIVRDVSNEKQAEETIQRLAYFDTLTGLPNRDLLKDRVAQAIRSANRRSGTFALAFLDLDRFKEVNDAFGHETGDRLLVHFARRLQGYLREQDTIARLGGDEFVLLLEGIGADDARERLDQVLEAATRPFTIDKQTHQVSASIGVALFPADGDSFEVLLKNADTAMYQAKAGGRDTCRFFHADMAEAVSSMAQIESAMRRALDQNCFHMVYQPQIDLATGQIVGLEALLRWQDGVDGRPISPGQFIPVAERCGLVVPLGEWVMNRVLRQATDWSDGVLAGVPISINVAAEQFWRDGFLDGIEQCLRRSGVEASRVVLELTERTAMKMPLEAADLMRSIKGRGIDLALDDFGTGYSSLAYIKRFPFQYLKIDRSFVADLAENSDDQAICKAIIQVAHTLGMKVVAEGVETPAQASFLRAVGCDMAQGFLYSPGLPAGELLQWCQVRPGETV